MLGNRIIEGRSWLPLLLAGGLMAAGATAPSAVAGQESGEEEAAEVEEPIEWNFRPAEADEAESVSLQERWDAPFAVVSSGRPAPREARRVVIPAAPAVARRTAAVAADSGETVAEVTVEGEGEAGEAAANPEVDDESPRAGTASRLTAAGADPPAPRRHTVSRGDTLFGIARRYGVSPQSIRSANRLADDVVRLGQTLVIPPQETSR